MEDQAAAAIDHAARGDLGCLVKTGATPETLEGCVGLGDLVLGLLDLPGALRPGGRGVVLYEVLTGVTAEQRQEAFDRREDFTQGSAPRTLCCQVAAAAELLALTGDVSEAFRKYRIGQIGGTWAELLARQDKKGPAVERQLRASLWLWAQNSRTTASDRHRPELLKALQRAIPQHVERNREHYEALAAKHLKQDKSPVTNTAPYSPPKSSRPVDGKVWQLAFRLRNRSLKLLALIILVILIVCLTLFTILAQGVSIAIHHLLPKPSSEPLRSISSLIDNDAESFSLALAIGIITFVLLFVIPGTSRRRTLLKLILAFVCFASPGVLWYVLYFASAQDLKPFADFANTEFPQWQPVISQEFDKGDECSDIKQNDMVVLQECSTKEGRLHFGVNARSGAGALLYPPAASTTEVSNQFLYGDFFAATRFRRVDNTPLSACALALRDVNSDDERYFHLDERLTEGELSYGAELVSRASFSNGDTTRKNDVKTVDTLPYILRPAIFEYEYSTEGAWTTLSILRHGDTYQFFVNRRLVASYRQEIGDNPTAVYLATMAGSTNSGGIATCEFDYLEIHSGP